MKPPVVLHCSLTREDDGSVPYLQAYHHRRDPEFGLQPRFISFFDRTVTWSGDCTSLAGRGWETVGALRRRFATAALARPPDIAIYHDGWGLDWFAPLDRAERRIVFLHTEREQLDDMLCTYAPLVDGFLSVSQGMADRVRRVLPDFPAERIRAVPYFVDVPAEASGVRSAAPVSGPVRFGYAGRIVRTQKRMERLPALLAALDRRNVDYRFEVMGAGSYLDELQRKLQGHPRVKFIPWQQGGDYWRVLAGWRAITLLSDFEGFSRAMLEGIMAGAIPLHPNFSPAAAELLGPAAIAGLYPVGDMEAAADRLAALARMTPAEAAALSSACRAHLAHLTPDNYFTSYRAFVGEILARPSRAHLVPPPAWHDWMPLGAYTRLFPRRF